MLWPSSIYNSICIYDHMVASFLQKRPNHVWAVPRGVRLDHDLLDPWPHIVVDTLQHAQFSALDINLQQIDASRCVAQRVLS